MHHLILKRTVFFVQILVILNLIPNILTVGGRIKPCCVVQQIGEKEKKSVKEVSLEVYYLDMQFRTQKFEIFTMLNDNIFNGSQTLSEFLSSIVDAFNFSFLTAIINSIVTSTILSKPTILQMK